ncbi:glutathione hydrolase 7-like isoform X2 [Myripristis murdjan]|uniref:glutathione hydrolase 7-like isoform X2 n=1 Tax=Myripristis murdjan TaxID=586833 RepID=UPI001175F3CB|nr:glutathione hydrolase 7-like isoform X2 [Myripristis murdjan]
MRADVSPETKLNNNQSSCNYKSFGGSPQLTDNTPPEDFTCDWQREHDEDTVASQVFIKGVLLSDHERCTALGQKVLRDGGSSVDAAVVATLCLGVVNPHVSGIGGGGLMLVHDIHKKETRVINFQETAPYALKEEMLHSDLELKPGLQVGVPGMFRGLHQAHKLYGRMSWEDVVTRAADVAREGFNVSRGLAEAIVTVKDEKLSGHFRSMFFPGGRALLPGSFVKIPRLAEVMEAGLSDFYNGSLSQEIVDEVRAHGGVLSREDISNYSAEVGPPLEGLYREFKVQVPPPPSVGAALISALNILEGRHVTESNRTADDAYHWIAESLKAALAMASGLGDPVYDSSVTQLVSEMLSKSHANVLRQMMSDSHAAPPEHYSTLHSLQGEKVAGQVVVMGPDDLTVSVASSLSRPFGSRIITPSGVLLNSHILGFSWPNKTQGPLQTNRRNSVQPGKRPLSCLMPVLVVPAWHTCGTFMALSNSDGDHSLSGIAQVLIKALPFHTKINSSLFPGRLHPWLQPNTLLVDSAFPQEDVQALHVKGHIVQRVTTLSVVHAIQRENDIIKAIEDLHSSDSFI